MKKIIGIFILMLYFSNPIKAEEISISLDDAIAMGLRDNREILLGIEDIKKAKHKIVEAKGGFLPNLNVSGSWAHTNEYYDKDFGSGGAQVTIKQYLYKGGKTVNTLKQSEYSLEVSKAILDKTKLETILEIESAFCTLLLATDFADLNKSIADNTREHLDFIKMKFENGEASESDVLKINESLSRVEQVYIESLSQVEASEAILKNLLYLDEMTKIKAEGRLVYEPSTIAYEEAFLKAMEKRPEIKQYEMQEKVDKRSVEIAKADGRPVVYAAWDYYYKSHAALGTAKNSNDYNIIGVTFSWPIFDGWITKAKVEQAIIDLKETKLMKEKTIKDIALDLKSTYLDFKNAISKLNAVQADVDLYRDTLSVTEAKYKSGIASSLDMSDASLAYKVSLFNQQQALYDYVIAKAKFDKAMGGNKL